MHVIFILGTVAVLVAIWVWHRRFQSWGALVAFCLGPTWGSFIYSMAFFRDGEVNAGLLFFYSLSIGGIIFGVPSGLFLAVLQFLARKAHDWSDD